MRLHTIAIGALILVSTTMTSRAQDGGEHWNAPDRAAKVAALIPGRAVPKYTPQTLFAEWTAEQAARWAAEHPQQDAEALYAEHAATAPTDAELTDDFPIHISPFGQPRGGGGTQPTHHLTDNAEKLLNTYCPFCGSHSFSLAFDANDPYGHAVTGCCKTHLYSRDEDWPADSPLKPTTTVPFAHLDDTVVDVACTLHTDPEGVEWELFIPTIFAHKRWLDQGGSLVRHYGERFRQTADPVCVHKIAILLDRVADTYYGLPLASNNNLCNGRDGKPLTRAEWEAVPRPAIFEVSYLGPWSKRMPYSSPGWLNMMDEHIWVEPFARVRHHPVFKQVSQKLHGDPEALDRKVMSKLMRELSLMFQSVFSQKLLHNYQEAIYIDLWLLGVLLEDDVLIDFAGPCQELSMYNHSYQDGMNGEGAPNYMAMPGGYYYPVLKDPNGWLQYQPDFLEKNPFYWAASGELGKLETVRGLQLEFGDQHEHAFAPNFISDPARVRTNERIGSRNWAGYGVGIIRVGGPGHRQEFALDYTRATLHNAQDALSMECWIDGVPVMRKGGYSAWWSNERLQWDRPEFQALKAMDYPYEIAEGGHDFSAWSWVWAHSPLCQNTMTVDEVATGPGWDDNRGYGECITFKGGETAGAPGSGFQVLDVRDHYSWARMDVDVSDWRRTAIGVEGPDGRPYVLDITHIVGGQRHALYNNAWAERAAGNLPTMTGEADTLAEVFFGDTLPDDTAHYRDFGQVRGVQRHAEPSETWDVEWQTDYAALAPREHGGAPFRRPLPDDVGRVRMRMIGLGQDDGRTELLSGKGPWIGWLRQALPDNQRADGNVAFMDARDFLIEYRTGGTQDAPLQSLFCHVIEGYREGEQSAIRSLTPLEGTTISDPGRQVVALRLEMAGGHTDTLIYQSEPGSIELADGLRTDARYALVRRDAAGEIIEVDIVRGSYLQAGEFEVRMPGELTGTIVDVIGDLTGTRLESALVIRPDAPWPMDDALHGRQLLVHVESDLRDPCNEGYRIEKTSELPGGLVRVDLQDAAPFATSWHEVKELPADRPNVIRTWRPMSSHANTPWYGGMKLWFPERGRLYTIKQVNRLGGGYGGDTVELMEDVSLRDEGIAEGDWYIIYAIEPGRRVDVASDFCFRRERAAEWKQYSVRATGDVTVASPITAGEYHCRTGGEWGLVGDARAHFAAAEVAGEGAMLIAEKPDWLNLNDVDAPTVVGITVDGGAVEGAKAADMGWIDPPATLTVSFSDAGSRLDLGSLQVVLNGAPVPEAAVGLTSQDDGRGLTVAVDMHEALPQAGSQARRHTLQISVQDRSIARREAAASVSYIGKVALDAQAVYLSDLKAVDSYAHAGLILDRDYMGDVAQIGDRVYPKCVMICPEPSTEGTHGRVVYELPRDRGSLTLHSDVGIEEVAKSYGSVVFMVQRGPSAEGPWETLYTSGVKRGGMEAETISVELGDAAYLRLYTTDGGDGINSDHALLGNARLKW